MPPKVKFQKKEIVSAAAEVLRKNGPAGLTAREVAAKLGVSTRPIFTHYDSMAQLRRDVLLFAKEKYLAYLERGLEDPIPFLGVWRQYLRFAQEETEFYRLLFLSSPDDASVGAIEALRYSQDAARESIMRIYHMDAFTADCYFRNIWLVAFSFATLIVTGNCPYSTEEMLAVGTEISLSVCKAYKEIPGLPKGDFDRDALFREIIKTEQKEER